MVQTLRQWCLEQWRRKGLKSDILRKPASVAAGRSGVGLVMTASGEETSLDNSVPCSCGYNSLLLTF